MFKIRTIIHSFKKNHIKICRTDTIFIPVIHIIKNVVIFRTKFRYPQDSPRVNISNKIMFN
jgi:hypothetical protein